MVGLGPRPVNCQTQKSEASVRPARPDLSALALLLVLGGLAHHQPPPDDEKWCTALGGHGRRSETPRHYRVEPSAKLGSMPRILRPRTHDRDPIGAAQRRGRLRQEGAAPLGGVEQHHLTVRPVQGQDQSGHAAAAAQVEEPSGRRAQPGREASGVIDLDAKGAGPEESQAPAPLQHRVEVVRCPHASDPAGGVLKPDG